VTRKPQSLVAKLAEACKAVSALTKQGKNAEFDYLRIADIADALRQELFSRGIVILPNDVECEQKKFATETTGRYLTVVRVKTEFTVTDGRTSRVFSAYGIDSDREDGWKALATAQTLALKSFLKRLGLIFGEQDDPDIRDTSSPRAQAKFPREKERVAEYQRRAWDAHVAGSGKTKKQIEAYLSTKYGFPVESQDITALSPEQFDVAMKWLSQNGDLIDTLEVSKSHAKNGKGKAQPVVALIDSLPAHDVLPEAKP
jgi:ERF superfamily